MKFCTNCGNTIADTAAVCSYCGTSQPTDFKAPFPQPRQDDTFLRVLCVLTIVGACFSLISIPISMLKVSQLYDNSLYLVQGISLLTVLGKLVGAIFMLQKKLIGLYIYTVAGVATIGVGLWSAVNIAGGVGMGSDFGLALTIFSLIFPIGFLVMYWLPVNRRVLS